MVNPLSFINKVVNKARGISPTPAPPRTNPKPQYKPIPKAPIEPISKIESVTSTPLVKRNVNPDPTDELIRKVNDPVLKKDLIDRLDFTPNQFGPKNSGNTKARDFDTFINRPDTPEVKDVAKGQPTGKHLDYWSLGKTRPGSNRTPANDYHDFLMGRDPQKEYKTKVLKGTMKEKIKDMKRYPGLYKKLKKANPGLSDRELVKKMDLLMDDTPEIKDVAKGSPGGTFGVIDYWSLGKTRPGSNRTPANDYHDFLMGRDPQKEFFNPKRVKMTAKQSKKFQNELKKNNKNKEPSWWQKMNAVNSDKDGNPTGYTYGLTGKKKKTKEDKKNYGMLGSFGSNLAKFSDDPFFFWQPKDR